MKKRFFIFLTLPVLVFSLLFCSCSGNNEQPTTDTVTSPHDSDSSYKAVFVMYDNGNRENEMRESFVSRMRILGYDEMKMKFDVKNAQHDINNLNEQIASLKGSDYSLIIAISDEAAVAVSKASLDIPCVFIGVTDPVSYGIATKAEAPDKNMTGTVMNVSESKSISLIRIFTPEVKTVGIMYCADNASAKANAELFEKKAVSEGLTVKIYAVTSLDDIEKQTESIIAEVDAIYAPADNYLDSAMDKITKVSTDNGKFVFSSGTSAVSSGALAAFCSSPTELAKSAAVMADRIIKGTKVSDIPIDYSIEGNIFLSKKTYSLLGIGIPDLEGLVVL